MAQTHILLIISSHLQTLWSPFIILGFQAKLSLSGVCNLLVYTELCIYPAIILGNSYYYLHFVNEEPEAQVVLACYQELNSSTEPKSSTSCSKKERASSEGMAKKIFIEACCRSFRTGTLKLGTMDGLQRSAWDYRQNYGLEVCVRERNQGPMPFTGISVFSDSKQTKLLTWFL